MMGEVVWRGVSRDHQCADIKGIINKLATTRNLCDEGGEIQIPSYEDAFFDAEIIPDFRAGIDRMLLARDSHERVAIYGDYDVDGVTSSAILAETFEKIGISVQVFLPHREDDGYGLSVAAVEKIVKNADLLVTIDNGSSAHQAIDLAVKNGVEVIVIDHHVVSEILPKALVINPHRIDSKYLFPDLCAAGLAYKFARCLLAHFEREDEAKWLMDLAALGTIADRVQMNGENRHIVQFGLRVLAVTKRLGLIALMGRAGLAKNDIDAENMAFKIIPRLNAAGRMQHADLAYALIRSKDHLEAEKLAIELDALNNSRRTITTLAVKEINDQLMKSKMKTDVLFFFGQWPVGILGILAGKIADESGKVTAVVNIGAENCTGSIRGNGVVDIVEILKGAHDILTKFGGHFTAGGFSFLTKDLDKVSSYFDGLVLEAQKDKKSLSYDLEIPTSLVGLDFINALKALEPHGEGNNRPIFLIRNLELKEIRDIGSAKEHKKFIFYDPNFLTGTVSGVAFHWGKEIPLVAGLKTDILCELKLNEFRGNLNVEIMVMDLRIAD